jgi:hypothetical protein
LARSDVNLALVEELTRAGRLFDAIEHVDRALLIDGLGIEHELVARLRDVWALLRDRRLARGRSASNERRLAA